MYGPPAEHCQSMPQLTQIGTPGTDGAVAPAVSGLPRDSSGSATGSGEGSAAGPAAAGGAAAAAARAAATSNARPDDVVGAASGVLPENGAGANPFGSAPALCPGTEQAAPSRSWWPASTEHPVVNGASPAAEAAEAAADPPQHPSDAAASAARDRVAAVAGGDKSRAHTAQSAPVSPVSRRRGQTDGGGAGVGDGRAGRAGAGAPDGASATGKGTGGSLSASRDTLSASSLQSLERSNAPSLSSLSEGDDMAWDRTSRLLKVRQLFLSIHPRVTAPAQSGIWGWFS